MVTVVYKVVTKEGNEEKFKEIALKCQQCAHESEECLYYSFFQSITDPKEFLVYYRFKDKKAQDKHILNLQKKIGPAKGKRDLPNKFLELLSDEEVVLFKLK
jgi:quinol monooxygenase YgiN